MDNRRTFLSKMGAGLIAAGTTSQLACAQPIKDIQNIVISTWNNPNANNTAFSYLLKANVLDAIEKGINVVEANPNDTSVGIGGMPDRDGNVTLDACIMDGHLNAGSVCYLKNYKHPISVARKVMEETPHVILAGEGAAQFAESQGFRSEDLMNELSRQKLAEWLEKSEYKPKINIEDHDTIGMLVKNENGKIAGGCSTSGLAFKMQGRVGDSPIIGAGLYVDGDVGGATATGLGELVLKTLSSFLVVEYMRMGKSPMEACELAIQRIIDKIDYEKVQVGLIAVNKTGEFGAFSIQPGFKYTTNNKWTNYCKRVCFIYQIILMCFYIPFWHLFCFRIANETEDCKSQSLNTI